MLQTIMLLIYLLLGAFIFSKVESWDYLDTVYWTVVTLFTVGFGDFYPTTDLGRSLLIPFALIGIITLALVISSVRSLILEHGRRCLAVQVDDRKRRKVIQKVLRQRGLRNLDLEASSAEPSNALQTEYERREAEFALMRQIQSKSSIHRRWMAMAFSTFLWLILWLAGAAVFRRAEESYQNWSYFDAFYFCFESWTTIGYGDLAPISNAGRSFYVFWSLLALPVMTILLSNASDTVVRIIRDGTILLGNITILPSEVGFVGNMKHFFSMVTFGKVFPDHHDTASPTPTASDEMTERPSKIMTDISQQSSSNDKAGCSNSSFTDRRGSKIDTLQRIPISSPMASITSYNISHNLPTGVDFHLLLFSEIRGVASHIKEHKPHHYTFSQWAWYLKLIGEDECSPQTHCREILNGACRDGANSMSESGSTWSWVGHGSPLLCSDDECQWILRRLMDRLQESLLAERAWQLGNDIELVH